MGFPREVVARQLLGTGSCANVAGKLGRDLAGSLGGCPTLEANVVKQKAFEEVSSQKVSTFEGFVGSSGEVEEFFWLQMK